MSEERTWNSEDTQLCSFKAFLLSAGCFIGQCTDSQHLRLLACLEAECIVFAMEGLLLTHDLRSTEESGVQCLIASVAGLNRREKEGKLPLIFSVFPKFQDSDKRDRVEEKSYRQSRLCLLP